MLHPSPRFQKDFANAFKYSIIFVSIGIGGIAINKREKWGLLSGVLGIALNLALFAFKYIYAGISGSLSLKADALNNLMDILSSAVIVFGFKIAARRADREHPYGHGRMEHIAGLIIAIVILFTGFSLGKDSIIRIFAPVPMESSTALYVILLAGILGKLAISGFHFALGKKIHSNTLVINAKDSGSDVLATSAVLFSLLAFDLWGWQIDGFAGLIVSAMILYAGFEAARETISTLMGEALSAEKAQEILRFVMANELILGVHDIALHSYGVRRNLLTLHAEVDGKLTLSALHVEIDRLERRIMEQYGYKTLIHVDPVLVCESPAQIALREIVEQALQDAGEGLRYTDFNCDKDGGHLYFDVYAPYEMKISGGELRDRISAYIHSKWQKEVQLGIAVNRY